MKRGYPLLALSGHWFGRRASPFLGVKQTSLVRDRVSVTWHGDSNSTFPAKNYGLPARRIREKPIQATEMQAVFCWDVMALSLQLGQISLQFPELQGET